MIANFAAAPDAAVTENARIEIHRDTWRRAVFRASGTVRRKTRARQILAPRKSFELAIPGCCSRVQGLGWSAINSSTSVRRARCTFSEFVFTTMPASTGRTQDAVKTRAPTSTTHIRHTPTGVSFCWWHKVGLQCHSGGLRQTQSSPRRPKLCFRRSSVRRARCCSCRPRSHRRYIRPFVGREADARRALSARQVCVHFLAKMLQYGRDWRRNHLSQTKIDVSRSASESSSISPMSLEDPSPMVHAVSRSTIFCEPTRHGTHFPQDSLRKNRVAFQRHVQHARSLSANHQRARTKHGPGIRE